MSMLSELAQITHRMPVVDLHGVPLGRVDRIEADHLVLTRRDSVDGHHHAIPCSFIRRVDSFVHLTEPGEQVMRAWTTE